MRPLTIYQVDAFTKVPFKGNPAGVVVRADGLNEDQMQAIAREMNNSETAFLFSPDDDHCDGIIRYFTPEMEVPTCGHATIAAMYAKAIEESLSSVTLRMKTQIGILPFEIIKTETDHQVVMTQGKITISDPLPDEHRKTLLTHLGITDENLDPECPLAIASTGHSKVMIGIRKHSLLNDLTPDLKGLKTLRQHIDCNGYFVFTFDNKEKDILTHGRMFAPAIGIDEDPVTGNANGPLGAYLVHHNIVDTDGKQFRFKGKQGEKILREGVVEVMVDIENGAPKTVRIKGDAVIVFKAQIKIRP